METEEKTYPEWEYVKVSNKCSFHKWATIGEWRKTYNGKTIAIVAEQRYAVPGGWLYQVRDDWGDEGFHPPVYVPSPYAPHVIAENERAAKLATAPHCQPTPPADDRPPMTDDELEAWLTATYGEPEHRDGTRADGVRYKLTHWFKHFSDDEDDFVEVATRCRNDWQTHHGGGWLPAWVIGPALWAAHRYGNP